MTVEEIGRPPAGGDPLREHHRPPAHRLRRSGPAPGLQHLLLGDARHTGQHPGEGARTSSSSTSVSRSEARAGRPPAQGPGAPELTLSPDAGRALQRERDALRLFDARSGAVLAAVGDRRSLASFLSDGRIGPRPGRRRPGSAAPRAGRPLRAAAFPLPGGATIVVVADQPGPQALRVVVSRQGLPAAGWDLQLLDLATGGSRSLGFRKLVSAELTYAGGPEARKPSRLTLDQIGGVLWFDPTSFRRGSSSRAPERALEDAPHAGAAPLRW